MADLGRAALLLAFGLALFAAVGGGIAAWQGRRRLHESIESMPVVARRIRQRINSDLAVFEGMMPASAVQRMRRAAHLAAFALAAWPLLSSDDLRRLYRPFADLIPPPRELLPD